MGEAILNGGRREAGGAVANRAGGLSRNVATVGPAAVVAAPGETAARLREGERRVEAGGCCKGRRLL